MAIEESQESVDTAEAIEMDPSLVLDVKGLVTRFYTYEGIVKALDGVTVQLKRGDTLALVGETGCGKSVTAKSIMRLVDSPGRIEDGQILFMDEDGPKDLLKISEDEMRHIRGNKISIVFQDPATYPNPVFKIGDQIAEVILLHQDLSLDVLKNKIEDLEEAIRSMDEGLDYEEAVDRLEHYKSLLDNPPEPTLKEKKQAAKRKAIAMLDLVRMPSAAQVANQYPHELSGGMRQRALIAMSLSCNPSILIADEATTALDVTVQAQVLKLLNDLKSELDASIIIITHDLGVVAETCTTVAVMYAGVVVEYADTEELFSNPVHPYTTGLLQAIPKLTERIDRLKQIEGTVPNLINPPTGCRFHPRCQFATEKCVNERPVREEVKPGHWVECWHPQGSMKGRK
ncbi:MAG: ABC transporter ATP-binding protein [Candidatus Thorarchaeota archaeon]